jgi:hypothetical protein
MKLIFSEGQADYSRYLYPYVVWGVPELGETPADFFAAGFLPASPRLDRFYLCRQLRLPLAGFEPNTENRRILRKGAGIEATLVARGDFSYTSGRRSAWLAYAAERFGEGIMHEQRLDTLMASPVISHLLVFVDSATGLELGTVLLYLEPPRVAFYYYSFYDLAGRDRNLGMVMMTQAAEWFAAQGYEHLHLGTCYSKQALYKTGFDGLEFFNGFRWSANISELKWIVRRTEPVGHLAADPEFQAVHGGIEAMASTSVFSVRPPASRPGKPG